jgi:broad specificity phosphatase PhoE
MHALSLNHTLGIQHRMRTPTIEEIQDSIEFLRYRDTFSRVTQEMLGWPLAQGVRVVDDRVREESFRVWFGHTSPTLDAAPRIARALMSPTDYERVGREANLHREIAWAIQGNGDDYDEHPDKIPGYNWENARLRVRAAISEYVQRHSKDT